MQNNPPVAEVAFSVQFPKIAVATVMDAASFFDTFKDRFPVFQQAARLNTLPVPQPVRPAPEGETPPPAAPFLLQPLQQIMSTIVPMIDGSALPRIWAITSDSKRLLQFQDDRFGLNWRRIVPVDQPSNYPGFNALHAEFLEIFSEFSNWYEARFSQQPHPIVAELVYVNSVPLHTTAGEKKRLSEVFKYFTPKRKKSIGGFVTNWVEGIDGETVGNLSVATTAGVLPDGTHAVSATFTARVSLANVLEQPEKWFISAHQAVLEVFDAVIISDNTTERTQ